MVVPVCRVYGVTKFTLCKWVEEGKQTKLAASNHKPSQCGNGKKKKLSHTLSN